MFTGKKKISWYTKSNKMFLKFFLSRLPPLEVSSSCSWQTVYNVIPLVCFNQLYTLPTCRKSWHKFQLVFPSFGKDAQVKVCNVTSWKGEYVCETEANMPEAMNYSFRGAMWLYLIYYLTNHIALFGFDSTTIIFSALRFLPHLI